MSDLEAVQSSVQPGQPTGTIEVTVRHNGAETKVIGNPENVVRELVIFFSKAYPSLELASKLVLSIDSAEFLQSCAGVLAYSPEGLVILKDTTTLKDRELMMLHVAGARMFYLMGKKENDSISLEELAKITGRVTGTIAGRLSELVREQLIERIGKGSYRLTTMGQRVVIQTLMPKAAQLPER
ncbi:hypothetical protein E6H32_05245 [Candidatus Bathyarchaeota archaeon]|nr:MAG: hypothetical protein E6H32_05245 [Candidatus Bathyarchaeota archaeon]